MTNPNEVTPPERGVRAVSGDRILWNRRPANSRDVGDIDEIVAHGVTVHVEHFTDPRPREQAA